MSDFLYYAQSIDDANLTYSATEDTDYSIENIQDRNINTFFKDTAIGVATVDIVIEFDSPRLCDYVIFGNYLATSITGETLVYIQCNTSNSWGAPAYTFGASSIDSSSLTTRKITFNTGSSSYKWWRLHIEGGSSGNIADLQIGTIFLGDKWEHNHNPEIGIGENSNYLATARETDGGYRFSQILNTTIRRQWNYKYKYITETEKIKFETWRDAIFVTKGLSHYPFYFSNDGGTTLYYVRNIGKLNLKEHAYQVYETSITLDEEK